MQLKHTNTIIFVTGGPGTGKSYAARQISSRIKGLTLLSYDTIKEQEWDRFGFDNAQQKDRLNWFALEEFYLTLQKMMWEGRTILTEYPFYQRHRDQLAALTDQYQYRAVTLLLYGDWKVIYERGLARNETTGRHPGHLTNTYHLETCKNTAPSSAKKDAILSYEEFRADIDRKNYDIALGTSISIDVTYFSKVNFDEITARLLEIDAE